jgi:hypothetical protein
MKSVHHNAEHSRGGEKIFTVLMLGKKQRKDVKGSTIPKLSSIPKKKSSPTSRRNKKIFFERSP